jgi:long-chain acyl-CoA synthetase
MSQSINYTTFASLYEHIIAGDNSTFLNGLRIGEYYSISTNEFGDIVRYLALALREMGINKGTPVALISDSSPWWLMIDYAIMIAGGYSVPMFTNLSQEHLDFELKDSAVKTVFIASNEKWQVMKTRKEQFDNLVLFEISDPDEHELHLENLIEDGKKIDASLPDLFNNMLNEVDPEQLATVVYTSGSTGNPKGVMLSHKNVISQLYATYDKFELKADDVAFSFLPLAHIFERMVMNYYLSNRVSVYFADDVKNVANLLKKVNPTLMTVVPRLLEKVYGKMQEKVETTEGASGLLARYAFNRAKTMDPFSDHAKFFDKCFTRTVYLKIFARFWYEYAYGH